MAGRRVTITARLRAAAHAIDTAVSPVFDVLREITDELLSAGDPLTVESLTGVRDIARRTVAGNSGWIAGTGYVAAIGALSDMPRWIEWWMAGPDASPRPLRVNLDPRLPDFYNYTSAEWFRLPRDTGSTSVDGPYVDVRGTNEYTVTVSTPVARNKAFLGVAAADLYISGLERRLMPILHAVSLPVVLSNASGRVIASTNWRVLPGQLLEPDDTRQASQCHEVPWQISTAAAMTSARDKPHLATRQNKRW